VQSVNVAQLKSELSRYLALVRNGAEIIVRDRDLPIAKLVPIGDHDLSDEEVALVAAGQLRPPRAGLPKNFWRQARPQVRAEDLARALEADRSET
jgi:antitoxin (DNA-binding transcriptional repressor) of toxin-antitoxin stability system